MADEKSLGKIIDAVEHLQHALREAGMEHGALHIAVSVADWKALERAANVTDMAGVPEFTALPEHTEIIGVRFLPEDQLSVKPWWGWGCDDPDCEICV